MSFIDNIPCTQQSLINNPKYFCNYINNFRKTTEIPSSVHYLDIILNNSLETTNLFSTMVLIPLYSFLSYCFRKFSARLF